MSEDFRQETIVEVEQDPVEQATGAKRQKGKKVVTWLLIASLGIGGIIGGAIGYKKLSEHIAYTEAKKNTTGIVSMYQSYDVCSLDETIYSSMNYDTKICDGSVLVEVLNEKGVKYCEILDEYYTNDGRNIALVTIEVTRDEYIDPTIINDEVKGSAASYFTLPEGYVLKGDKGYRQVTETITVVTEVRKDGDYSKIAVPGGTGKITKVVDTNVIGTKPFDIIAASDFVCDVNDDFAANKNGDLSVATYTIKPKRN